MLKSNFTFRGKTRVLVIFFIFALLLLATPMKSSAIRSINTGALSTEITNSSFTFDTNPDPFTDTLLPSSAFPFPDTRVVRVAIYDEPNATAPTYDGSSGDNNNNITNLVDILSVNPRIDITVLNAVDISNRVLTTANFDVFAMVDNNPREFIFDMVMDFWLAGGGLITFDGPASFLAYSGILPPESVGNDGYLGYWSFSSDGFNITARHPVAKAYDLETSIPADGGYGYCSWDWSVLSGSAIASDITPIAHGVSDANEITILAFDPTDRGGKVVTIGFDLDHEEIPALDQLIRDSVDWLAPRPKGRIAFDLSHHPRLSIDAWDQNSLWPDYYYGMRDYLVSNGYTLDKLYPAAVGDNFTVERLEPYDMLIINTPDFNYTVGDQVAIETYIANGGSLLAMGDRPDGVWFSKQNEITSTLLAPFGLSIHPTYGVISTTTFNDFILHPTTENTAAGIELSVYGYVNITGPAYPIWHDGSMNIVVAGSEFGEGRVILTSDINWLQSSGGNLDQDDNKQYLLNVANWLTSARANVLIYTDWTVAPSFYRTPLALALNDLGVKYYLTAGFSSPYFDYWNLSLNLYPWDLVIVDNPNYYGLDAFFDEIIEYIDSGGHLLMSFFDVDASSANPLWAKLGFEHNVDFTNEPPVYIWDVGHDIFNQPVNYNANNFTVGTAYLDDGDRLTVFPNATALAGFSPTEQAGDAIIVLRNDEQTLFNSYLIDEFTSDIDDSTYTDSFELWKNEIAFMLRPKLEFNPIFPDPITVGNNRQFTIEIPNFGLSDATLGLIEIVIPGGLGSTSDDLLQPFSVMKGDASLVTWNVQVDAVGNYTLTFTAIYQGFIGTIYGTGNFDVHITVSKGFVFPQYLWYIIGGALGALLIIIIIVAVVRKRKSRIATR
ncbi:MAG: hypothetical protein KGD59_01110 [Candidatus Heimdallarchaeota archaeon]|nr:hypothetical protein [Candidatus Heimdallarchaeota archaeon]MBY8993118.1 hypothetical protein [Candidatus Heimdallarchaeota archaeon]